MSARPVHSSSSNPLRTPDPAPANNPAQGQPRLRSDAGNIASTNVLNQLDAYEHDDSNAEPSDDDALLLQTLHERLTAIRPPLPDRLDDIVDLFSALKAAERPLRAVFEFAEAGGDPAIIDLLRQAQPDS